MRFINKTIFTGFSPNIDRTSVRQACGFLFFPWKWKVWRSDESPKMIEQWLKTYFDTKYATTFDSGRTALFYALKALGVGEGDEVLVQAYTCVVVINAIKWTGATPVFVDIKSGLNMDPEDAKRKVSDNTKVMIIQHTFGQPAKMEVLMSVARDNNLKTVEDCAHSLGAKSNGQLTGTFGDIGMFSFGSDKIVSCVRGGGLITKSEVINKKIEEYHARLPETDRLLIFQHLMHYPLFFIGKALYSIKIGKWILGFAKKLHIINRIIYRPEKQGKQLQFYPTKLPNSLASILLGQLGQLDSLNNHRREIANLYGELLNKEIDRQITTEESIHLRYTLFVNETKKLRSETKKEGIILGDWYDTIIAPRDIDMVATGYKSGDCPQAELYSKKSINLPTNRHISKTDAKCVAGLVNHLLGESK